MVVKRQLSKAVFIDIYIFFVIIILEYGGIQMEQRKSDINTGDGNVVNVDTNGLSYSFDFSSQVQNNSQVAPVQQVPQAEPVQPVPQVEPVQPAPQVEPVQPVPQVEPVQPAPQVEPVQPVPQAEPVQPMPQVEPVQSVTTQADNNSSSDDLISDKKSTKAFLIVLALIIIGFIIFLDPIYNFVSNLIG